jgi:hypothetical protein
MLLGGDVVSPAEREAAFRAELEALLKRHCAEMTITDDGKPWGLHSPVVLIQMCATDENEFAEFQL